MKVYVHEKGVVMVGKAWEIKRKLTEYGRKFPHLQDWIKHVSDEKKQP